MIARHARATLRVRTETLGVGVGIKNETSKKLKTIGIGKATELRRKDPLKTANGTLPVTNM